MPEATNGSAFPFSQNLFWDSDIADIDLVKHQRYIIERVMTRGRIDDFKKMNAIYDRSEIVSALTQSRDLDPKTLHFCTWYYHISPEDLHVSSYYG